jgi:signal transduction histidine kinase
VNEPTLAERLGGRWAISLAGHALAVAAVGLVLANLVRREGGGLHLRAAGLALLLSAVATATTDVVLHRTLFARRAVVPVPVWWVMVKHASAGLVLAGSLWWVANGLVEGLDPPAPSLWFTLPALAMWGGSTLSVSLDLWSRSARARLALLSEAERLDLVVLQQQALVDDIMRTRATAVTHVLDRLRSDLDAAARSMVATDDDEGRQVARRLADDLRQASQGVVRQTSSELWNQAERQVPRVSWRRQLVNVVRTQPLRPLVIVVVGVIPSMVWQVGDLGLVRSGVMALAGAALLGGVCELANRVMSRWPAWHATVYLASVVLLQIGQVVSAVVRNSWIPGYVTRTDLVVQVVTGVLIIVFSSGWGTFGNLGRRRDQVFAERMTPARELALARSVALAQAARSLAHDLHGGAQSRLFASALALEEAADRGDVAMVNQALAAARDALEQPLAQPVVEGDVAAAVTEATRAWTGLCEVSVQRPEALGDGFDPVAVRRVVDEGLMNAVRHGGASRVEMALSLVADGRLRIEVRHHGPAIVAGSQRGLGSAMFDQLAPNRWGRHSDDSGTTLWVELLPATG